MSLEAATTLANRLLMTAAEFDTATGGVHPEPQLFATLKLLSQDGIQTISIGDQDRCWQEASK